MDNTIDRGSAEDQERWLAELDADMEALNFPLGGSLILAESPSHALTIADEMRAKGHRTLVRGVYVRTTATPKNSRGKYGPPGAPRRRPGRGAVRRRKS